MFFFQFIFKNLLNTQIFGTVFNDGNGAGIDGFGTGVLTSLTLSITHSILFVYVRCSF
jgi:hypothetical protein